MVVEFREAVAFLRARDRLASAGSPGDPHLGAARAIREAGGGALAQRVRGVEVVSGIVSRVTMAACLGVSEEALPLRLAEAMEAAPPPFREGEARFEEAPGGSGSFSDLPVLTHFEGDGGPYLTGSVFFYADPERGPNASFHRMMVLDDRRASVRVVEGRGLHLALEASGGTRPVAVCLGTPIQVQAAASCPLAENKDELAVANVLSPTEVASVEGIRVPASSEIVLFGTLGNGTASEGPFVDVTGTPDIERKQPVFVLERMLRREGFLYHAILPGGPEHRFLMGFPREAAIRRAVAGVCGVRAVRLTPGGCGWLHAVLVIEKEKDGDPETAGLEAFRAHPSLKHCVVVDGDIDPDDPMQVEWAVATRFQADRDLTVLEDQPSSSLDPSARHLLGRRSTTAKTIVDATRKGGGPYDRVV